MVVKMKKEIDVEEFDIKSTLENILSSYREIERMAEDKALDMISKVRHDAILFQCYKDIYTQHEVRKFLRKTLSESRKYTNNLYNAMV